jgi:hypothetical protein
VQEEGFTRAVLTDDESRSRATVRYPLQVLDERSNFMHTAYLEMLLAASGNYASAQ